MKKNPVLEGHVLVIVCQIWLNKLTVSIIKTCIWHQESKGVLYLSSPTSKKLALKVHWLQKTAYFLLHGEQQYLKMSNIRIKKACVGAFPTIISLLQSEFQLILGAETLLCFITLGGISPHTFPVITWIHSSVFCFLILYTTSFFDHY